MRTRASLLFLWGAVANLLTMLLCSPLMGVPPGATIKPIGLVCPLFLIGCFAPAIRITLFKDYHRPDGNRVLEIIGSCLCFTSIPLTIILWHLIAWLRGFSFG